MLFCTFLTYSCIQVIAFYHPPFFCGVRCADAAVDSGDVWAPFELATATAVDNVARTTFDEAEILKEAEMHVARLQRTQDRRAAPRPKLAGSWRLSR